METMTVKSTKVSNQKSQNVALRIKKETKKKIESELFKLNKKDFGRTLKADDYIAMAINLVKSENLIELQNSSLRNQDRFEIEFKKYISTNGNISKDEFLGIILGSEKKIIADGKKAQNLI